MCYNTGHFYLLLTLVTNELEQALVRIDICAVNRVQECASFAIKYLAHPGCQRLRRKWFLNEINAIVQHAMVRDNVACIAGHEQFPEDGYR